MFHLWLLQTKSCSGSSIFSMFVFSIFVVYDHMKQTLLFLFLLCQLLPKVKPVCSLCETLLCQQLGQWCLISTLLFRLQFCARPFHCRCALHGVLLCFLDGLVKGSFLQAIYAFRSQFPGSLSQMVPRITQICLQLLFFELLLLTELKCGFSV